MIAPLGGASNINIVPPKSIAKDEVEVYGDTELDADEVSFLLPSVKITTLGEAYEVEQRDSIIALLSVRRAIAMGRYNPSDVLTDSALRDFHKSCYGGVWTWAGKYRIKETNLGVDPALITEKIRVFMQDSLYWCENKTFPSVELAVRTAAGVTSIHPFFDGNGRTSRHYATLVLDLLGDTTKLTWGSTLERIQRRRQYIGAIRKSERSGDYSHMVKFAVS